MILDFAYLILKNKLTPLLPDVRLIEWDEEKDLKKGELRTSPALFIRFEPFESLDLGGGAQQCNVPMTVRLVTKSVEDADGRIRKNAGGHLAIAREVFIALQQMKGGLLSEIPEFAGLSGTEDDELIINAITRTGGSTQHTGDELIRSEQTFMVTIYDHSACPGFAELIGATFEITTLEI